MPLSDIKLLILDVDGVLTDGSITLSDIGEPCKTFHVQDGFAIKLWQRAGGEVALLSGRESTVVAVRAAELGIEIVHQGVEEKSLAYEQIKRRAGLADSGIGYVGDDLPDLPPMKRCGFPVAVVNAAPVVKRVAHYVTRRVGGSGAVAEVVELILRKQARWRTLVDSL